MVPKKDGVLLLESTPSNVTSTSFCNKRTSTKNFASSPKSSLSGGHFIKINQLNTIIYSYTYIYYTILFSCIIENKTIY